MSESNPHRQGREAIAEAKRGFTYTEDLPTHQVNKPHVINEDGNLEEIGPVLAGIEDAVSALQERVAVLEALARKDHPELTAQWPDPDQEEGDG